MRDISRRLVKFSFNLALLAGTLCTTMPAKVARAQSEFPYERRIPAPSLDGGGEWINTPVPLDVSTLRGKFVLLDFWTYCCINCMHILPELKKLEHKYPKNLVVIGVHSAKFPTERDARNIREAILRYEIEHPVINDALLNLWNKFEVDTWPSLRLIDPHGNLVAGFRGEVTFETLDKEIRKGLGYFRRHGALDESPLVFDLERARAAPTPLRYPGKVLADPLGDRLFIADSNHNRIVVCSLDGELLDTIGSGAVGDEDGGYATASFDHPQGMALVDETLYVADTENHLIRRVDLAKRMVTTLAGTGKQRRTPKMHAEPGRRPIGVGTRVALNSPWALCVAGDYLYVAMAGAHQIWRIKLGGSQVELHAGSGIEDIADGPPLGRTAGRQASFAQPSGLATDGQWLYVADSEGSSIRAVPLEGNQPVNTPIGTAGLPDGRLFTNGDVDGAGTVVRLQHPLDVAWQTGGLFIADTYNSKIKLLDFASGEVATLPLRTAPSEVGSPGVVLNEPGGISLADDNLYIADTNNPAIKVVDLNGGNVISTLEITGLAPPSPPRKKPSFAGAKKVRLESVTVTPQDGSLTFKVQLQLAEGLKLNEEMTIRYWLETSRSTGLLHPDHLEKLVEVESADVFEFKVPIQGEGENQVELGIVYYYCSQLGGLCKVGSVVFAVPLNVQAGSDSSVVELTARVP